MAALLVAIGAPALVVAQSSERSLSIHNIHTKETVTAVYKRNGRFVEAGLQQLSQVMRDHRRNEATKMDPELIDLLWQIHHELGSKEPIHLISGYRSRATNDMLRKSVGGQASESRHILGKAADVHFPDVALKQIRYSALIQERGGVGYYPTSALPFVHVDTDRVRSWPRLPRTELALLFPSGSTKHAAADGGPITKEDVRLAEARSGEIARQIALFHSQRGAGGTALAAAGVASGAGDRPPERVAALARPITAVAPSLVEQGSVAGRLQAALPQALKASLSPSAGDRARLAELAGLASTLPQLLGAPSLARRPEKPALPSLTGDALPVPPGAVPTLVPSGPERQVASLGPSAGRTSASLTDAGRFAWGAWVPVPAYDDEHPEELSYRPFPIVPYLTETASQPLMSELVPHDVARTLELLDVPEAGQPLHFRPTPKAAGALWALQFKGALVGGDRMRDNSEPAGQPLQSGLASRPVRTSQR